MGIVNKKYDQLKPELRYLADEVVLAQAWKKAHTYIRSFNWYVDTLELDSSVVNLEQCLKDYKQILANKAYKPGKLKMVPAPKADSWILTCLAMEIVYFVTGKRNKPDFAGGIAQHTVNILRGLITVVFWLIIVVTLMIYGY